MLVIIGSIIVLGSVLGGFMMAGGNPMSLIHVSEFIVIGGAAIGAMIIMSPMSVLMGMLNQILGALKGSHFGKKAYEELFKALYELFLLGRRNGMIALEEHVMEPENSSIFSKYPSFVGNKEALRFVCEGIRPVIDGKVKPEQLKSLLDIQLETMEDEHHKPVETLTKVADAMPGFGIVAAVLGIIITMGAISGPIEMIGHKVAAALVGTFLGILVSYGFLNPLACAMQNGGESHLAFFKSIASCLVAFANGLAPVMAIEVARRALPSHLQVSADELEETLKAMSTTE